MYERMVDDGMTDSEREALMNRNLVRMQKVNNTRRFNRIYDVVFNILMILGSIFGLISWFFHTGYDIRMKSNVENAVSNGVVDALRNGDIDSQKELSDAIYDMDIDPVANQEDVVQVKASANFPPSAVTMFIVPLILASVICVDTLSMIKFRWAPILLYGTILVFTVINLLIGSGLLPVGSMVLFIIYSTIGIISRGLAMKAMNEEAFLSTQEGYPDFLYMIHRGSHSEQAKKREEWLNKKRERSAATDAGKPALNYNTVSSDDGMEGISIGTAAQNEWFDDAKDSTPETPELSADIDGLQADPTLLPDDSEYIVEDPRKKPLW